MILTRNRYIKQKYEFEWLESFYNKKEAFEDDVFINKYFRDSLNIYVKSRNIYTCIVLENRLFYIWAGDIYELDMVWNSGIISSLLAKWIIWKEQKYSNMDLVDFLRRDGIFMQDSLDKYFKELFFARKTIKYESYMWNIRRLCLMCDEQLRLVEKN